MSETEQRIDAVVARLARGRRARREARDELKDHLREAAGALAGQGPVRAEHVDRALDKLGGEAIVRETFFPAPRPARLHRLAPWATGAIVLALLGAIALDLGGSSSSTCVAGPGATCTVSSSATGGGLDAALLLLPPILALLVMAYLPPWCALAIGVPYATWTLLRASVGYDEFLGATGTGRVLLVAGLEAAAGLALAALTLHHLWRARRAG
jgi:hypothetical protein